VSQTLLKGGYYEFLLNINTIHIVLIFTKIYTVRILKIVLHFVNGCSIKCIL